MKPRKSKPDYLPLIVLILIAIPIMALVAYSMATASPQPQNQIRIEISGPNKFSFSPNSLTIRVGDSVTWVNSASFPFTVVSDNSSDPFDSGSIAVGMSYVHTFNTPGIFHYHSSIPNTTGTVTVES